jgi:hypothetical protein
MQTPVLLVNENFIIFSFSNLQSRERGRAKHLERKILVVVLTLSPKCLASRAFEDLWVKPNSSIRGGQQKLVSSNACS